MRGICFTILIAFAFGNNCVSQNITGTWEGLMSDEYIKISVMQKGNDLCGQTFDVVIDNKKNYCKAYFTGYYDNTLEIWYMKGFQFIENSGEHLLMTIKLWRTPGSDSKIMMANVTTSDAPLDFFGLETGENFWIRKISSTPQKLDINSPICYKNQTVKKEVPQEDHLRPETSKSNTSPITKKKTISPPAITDSIVNKPKQIQPADSIDRNEFIQKEMSNRKNTTISQLIVHSPKIEISIYDNGIVDNDTVSIFFDGKLIVSHQRLSAVPIRMELDVSDTGRKYRMVMFAENLGSIPPNTALVVVKAGKKRYELHSSANLNENAELLFIYEPIKEVD